MIRLACLVLMFASAVVLGCGPSIPAAPSEGAAAPLQPEPPPLLPPPAPVAAQEPPLAQYVGAVMDVCRPKLSVARRTVLAQQVARVAGDAFPTRRDAEAFSALICIESRFDGAAKSSVGAVGLAQVMPQFAAKFAADCGLGTMEPGDLHDSEFNLRLGACVFRGLLERFDGNTALALAAYNSGAASAATTQLGRLGSANHETANYVARFLVVREAARRQQ